LTRLAAIPGVQSVGVTNQVPLKGEGWVCELRDMRTPGLAAVGVANFRFVNPDYWETLGIPLKAGRLLESADRNRGVAVLSERAAQALWPGESAIGKRVGSCGGEQEQQSFEVVGVVGDVRASLEKEAPLTVYETYTMTNMVRQFFLVRTRTAPESTVAAMRSVFRALDPNLPVSPPATMPEILDDALAGRRFQMSLAVAFAGVGLVLAAVGIYGVISFTVARRTSELGIRIALGARAPQVASMVIRQGMMPVFAGLGAGLSFALLMGRFIASQLYGTSPHDPWTVAAAAAVLLVVAVFACWIPARRAMRIDPLTALRFE
jgi:putative ABC transport system permease protein